ncbi:hypothetical protein GWK47_037124 [Chionoecetes opilio]|uniref:Uncharacterized protein n=1 Tax=Chionoecetes opilio TaxID=41210 RepID=A0A8J4YNB3_CHIOP|nr:hypothetical protein GWK47_037124 [Chionoecetes opilio]
MQTELGDNELTDALQYTSLGPLYDMTHDTTGGHPSPAVPWTPQSPDSGFWAPPASTPTYTKLGMTADPHCPGAPHTRTHLNTSSWQCPRPPLPPHGAPPITIPTPFPRSQL